MKHISHTSNNFGFHRSNIGKNIDMQRISIAKQTENLHIHINKIIPMIDSTQLPFDRFQSCSFSLIYRHNQILDRFCSLSFQNFDSFLIFVKVLPWTKQNTNKNKLGFIWFSTWDNPFSGNFRVNSCPSTLRAISSQTDFNVASFASVILRWTAGKRRIKRKIVSRIRTIKSKSTSFHVVSFVFHLPSSCENKYR